MWALDGDENVGSRNRRSRRERGLHIARMAALAPILEARAAARHIGAVRRDEIVDAGLRRARDAVAVHRRPGEHARERLQCAPQRVDVLWASRWSALSRARFVGPQLVGRFAEQPAAFFAFGFDPPENHVSLVRQSGA